MEQRGSWRLRGTLHATLDTGQRLRVGGHRQKTNGSGLQVCGGKRGQTRHCITCQQREMRLRRGMLTEGAELLRTGTAKGRCARV